MDESQIITVVVAVVCLLVGWFAHKFWQIEGDSPGDIVEWRQRGFDQGKYLGYQDGYGDCLEGRLPKHQELFVGPDVMDYQEHVRKTWKLEYKP